MYFKSYCVIFLAELNFSAFQISKEGIGEIHRRSFHCRRNLNRRQIDVVDLAKKDRLSCSLYTGDHFLTA